MNTEMKKRIEQHGRNLLAIFPNAIEKDPVKLCKKLRRIETAARYGATCYCNGCGLMERGRGFDFGANENDWEDFSDMQRAKVEKVLNPSPELLNALIINGDARGYALKIGSDFMRVLIETGLNLQTDMGGYGIIAPDLTED